MENVLLALPAGSNRECLHCRKTKLIKYSNQYHFVIWFRLTLPTNNEDDPESEKSTIQYGYMKQRVIQNSSAWEQ